MISQEESTNTTQKGELAMSGPIRILHVVTYMGRGGLETMLMNYYRNIDRNKIQFDFLTHRSERYAYDDEIEQLGGKIYRLPRLNPWSNKYLNELARFFQNHTEYKIVHAHLDCMSGIPLAAAKKAGIPIRIAHSHSSSQDKNSKYLLKLYYKRKIPQVATELFACGEAAGKWMFGCNQFRVLPNAIDAQAFSYNPEKRAAIRKAFDIENALVIGHVGNFTPVKNHKFLLKILKQMLVSDENVKLLSVGDGPLFEEIKNSAREMGLDSHIIFAGSRSDVADCMQAMDVFVLPSLYEGLPVTMIEAQSSGLPCLISDKVPIECKKTNLVKQIMLEQDISAWTESIKKMAAWKRRNTYEEIADSGFDIKNNAKWLQNFYNTLWRFNP